jgi:hypothetical protein
MANAAGERQSPLNMWKDLVTLLRDGLLLLIGVLLVLWPSQFSELLVRAGFEEGSVVGFKWKGKLVDTDQALKEANATITDLRTQNEKLAKELSTAQPKSDDPAAKERIAKLQQDNRKLNEAANQVESKAQVTIAANAALVEKAQVAAGNTRWAVVYGGDTKLDEARYEVTTVAKKLGLPNSAVYLRQGSYRSVTVAETREEAEQALFKAKNRRSDAYIVNMSKWCPKTSPKDGYFECSGA